MKTIILSILLLVTLSVTAQKKIFLRIFNSQNIYLTSGYLNELTDTSVKIIENRTILEIPIQQISVIHKNRGKGNRIFIGSVVGAAIGATTGLLHGEDFHISDGPIPAFWIFPGIDAPPKGTKVVDASTSSNMFNYGVVGMLVGAATGFIANAILPSDGGFFINGDNNKWMEAKLALSKYKMKELN